MRTNFGLQPFVTCSIFITASSQVIYKILSLGHSKVPAFDFNYVTFVKKKLSLAFDCWSKSFKP
jgi:hypothetical protein